MLLDFKFSKHCYHSTTLLRCRLPVEAGVTTHLLKLPEEAKRAETCLRWLQPQHANGNAYVGCWGIDNVLISDLADTPTFVQDNFDPIDTDNWLFIPGATVRVSDI